MNVNATIDSNYNIIKYKGNTILQINANALAFKNEMQIDYIILSNNTKTNLTTIATNTKPKMVIADGSNSLWKIEKWKAEAKELNLPFFNITQDGAFILEL
jgi:competence protein ComEC